MDVFARERREDPMEMETGYAGLIGQSLKRKVLINFAVDQGDRPIDAEVVGLLGSGVEPPHRFREVLKGFGITVHGSSALEVTPGRDLPGLPLELCVSFNPGEDVCVATTLCDDLLQRGILDPDEAKKMPIHPLGPS